MLPVCVDFKLAFPACRKRPSCPRPPGAIETPIRIAPAIRDVVRLRLGGPSQRNMAMALAAVSQDVSRILGPMPMHVVVRAPCGMRRVVTVRWCVTWW